MGQARCLFPAEWSDLRAWYAAAGDAAGSDGFAACIAGGTRSGRWR